MNFQQLYLHHSITDVKKRLKECTFLAFEQEKGEIFFSAKMKNKEGGKDSVKIKINKGLQSLQPTDFEELYTILNEKTYESGTGV